MPEKPTYEELEKEVLTLKKTLLERNTFLNHTPDHMIVQDIKQRVIWANSAAVDSVGMKLEDIIDRHCYEVWQGIDKPCEGCPILKTIKTGKVAEKDTLTPNGRAYHIRGGPIYDGKNRIIGAYEYARDITDRVKAEEEQKKSEEKYRLLVENQQDLIIHADAMQKIIYASPNYCATFGKTEKEIVGSDFKPFIHPEDVDLVKKSLSPLINPPYLTQHQERALTVKGWRWFAWSVKGRTDKKGKLSEMFAIGRDITRLKQAEEIQLNSQKLMKAIIEVGQLANSTIDIKEVLNKILEGTVKILTASSGMIFIKDHDTETLSWGTSLGLSKYFVEDYQDRPIQLGEGLTGHIAQTGKPIYIKKNSSHDPRIQRRAIKKENFNSFIGVPLHAGDHIVGVMNILTHPPDILNKGDLHLCEAIGSHVGLAIQNAMLFEKQKQTKKKLKHSEKKFRSMMEAIKDPIYICSPDYIVEYMNPSMVKKIGYDAIGEYCYESLHGLNGRCEWCQFSDPNQVHFYDMEIKSPLDNHHYIVSQFPLIRQDGRTSKLTFYKNISELKKNTKHLQQAQKMETVGQLAGGVAHDFNNMLGVILGHTELALLQADETHDLYSDLKEIQKAAERSADITKQLLAFARKQTIYPIQLDLNDTVENMLNMLRRLIGENIDLVWKPSAHLWPVEMDPTQIDQILVNLCVNAKDAISGVGKLTIETEKKTFDEAYCKYHTGFIPGDFVMLVVSDDGCGMDKETENNVFEPFYTTKKIGEGTGLGLATVYGILKQNNGFINVYSELGLGSTFNIYLPRLVEDKVVEKVVPQKKSSAGGTETILLVEDETSILKMTQMMLERKGYTVLSSATPAEAMKKAKNHCGSIDLLMTDVVMPEMNGRDLAGEIIARYPDMRLLFMSGYPANVIAHQGILDHGVPFIQKPFSMADLTEKLRKILDMPPDKTQQ